MGNRPDGFRVELNRDPLMNFVAHRLGIETIYCAFFFHFLVVLYVWATGNLFELSVPPHIEATVDISQLQLVTPLKDPIFITGIIFIVITGYVWLKLSSELPEALEDLERNGIVKEKKIVKKEDEDIIVVFRRPFKFLKNFYTNKIAIPKVKDQKDVDEFDIFLKRFDYTLNNRLCYVAGVVGVLMYLYTLYQYTIKTPVEESLILIWLNYRFFPVYFVIYQAIWIVGYFILTVIVWKMLQIAAYHANCGEHQSVCLCFRTQPGHCLLLVSEDTHPQYLGSFRRVYSG